MTEYQKAPYLELNEYKAPDGVKSIYIKMKDKKKIRLLYWNIYSKETCKGTVILQQGHNEFIEKYYETVQDFIDRKFNVVCFDWRGQGLSDKMVDNIHKQHIEDFDIHTHDLKFILKEFIYKYFPKPFIGIGHSMGGCILLASINKNDQIFDKVILSSPMLGFKNETLLMPLISLLSLFGSKESYFIGSKPNMGKETPFEENDLTSDKKRYMRTLKLVRKNPNIRLWGVTNRWVQAVKKVILVMRKKEWTENIYTPILLINSLKDKVVSPNQIVSMSKRLKNSRLINFESCKHEIFMEKDCHREKLWNYIDEFLNRDLR